MPYKAQSLKEIVFSYYNPAEATLEHFYPCIKYKIKADEKFHGTNSFTVAESVHTVPDLYRPNLRPNIPKIECNLSFTCENHQKVFYKLIKGRSKTIFSKMDPLSIMIQAGFYL